MGVCMGGKHGRLPKRKTGEHMKLLAGTGHKKLAQDMAAYLGVPLVPASLRRFADQEIFVEIHESIRGQDVFVIQPTCSPVNDHLMELLILMDALKRGSAGRITACIPYFGYGRQDRKSGPRTPISAKLVADLLTVAGAQRVVTLDLHAGQIQGFFNIPVDNLFVTPLFARDIQKRFPQEAPLIVSPDVGGVVRARSLAKRLNTDMAIVDKRRVAPGDSHVMHVIGEVSGRQVIIIDDIVDSGKTLCLAAEALWKAGASHVHAYATHCVLSQGALERINHSALQDVTFTDTIPKTGNLAGSRMRWLSVAPLLAQSIQHIHGEKSLSTLFEEEAFLP